MKIIYIYIYLMYIRISKQKPKTKTNKKKYAPLHSFLLINRHRITVARPRQMITMIDHRRHRRIWVHPRPVIINGVALAAVVVVAAEAQVRIGLEMILAVSDISVTPQWVRQSDHYCVALPAPIIYHAPGAQCPYAAA